MPTLDMHTQLMQRLAELERENEALREQATRLEQEERNFRYLYENAPVGMYEIDFRTRRYVSVNRVVLEYTGYSREEFLAMDPVALLTEESRNRFFERYAKIQRGEEVPPTVEFQIKVKSGRVVWALLQIRFLREKGRIVGASVVAYNIDEHKHTYQALKESEERFRRLVETMKEGLVILDDTGKITYVNKHLEETSGYRAEELVGRTIDEFLSPEASQLIRDRLFGENRDSQASFEMTWHRKTGETRYSIVSPQVLDDSQGVQKSSFAIITDITSKKETENALRQRERELENYSLKLEEMNTALRKLLKVREEDKHDIERNVSSNLKQMVNPLIERLKASGLNQRQRHYLDLVSRNMEDVTAAFDKHFASQLLALTPIETEVANFVRYGYTTKEIASMMHLSPRTVDMHRMNIRRKLGLHRRGTNLRTYLMST